MGVGRGCRPPGPGRAVGVRGSAYAAAARALALPAGMLTITVVAGPLAALLVAFVQFFRETRADRLGFLLHRPVSRSTIFACKAAVGLVLYALALGVPLLVALWWASYPANV